MRWLLFRDYEVALNLVLGVIIIVAAAAIGIGAMLLVRRNAPEGSYFADSDRSGAIFGVLAGGFAILLGFIVFLAFASYDESRNGAETESLVVREQYQTAQFLPAEVTEVLTGQLICYGRYVVNVEWPVMESGTPDEVNPWSVALFLSLSDLQLDGPIEESAFDAWFDQTIRRQEARQDRVHGAEGIMPWPLWIVLIGVALLVFAYMLLFADKNELWWVQCIQMGVVVAVITSTMLVIQLLNTPFQEGPAGLDPTAMQRTLDSLDAISGIGIQGEPPCNERGEAL